LCVLGVTVLMRCVMVLIVVMRMVMAVLMSVVPQLGFVEQKEKHQTQQQCHKQLLGWRSTFEGLG